MYCVGECGHNATAKQRRKLHHKLATCAAAGPIQTVVAVRVVLPVWHCATRPLAMAIPLFLLLSTHLVVAVAVEEPPEEARKALAQTLVGV